MIRSSQQRKPKLELKTSLKQSTINQSYLASYNLLKSKTAELMYRYKMEYQMASQIYVQITGILNFNPCKTPNDVILAS